MGNKYVVGIDIGGTHTVVGIVDHDGKILGRKEIKTRGHKDFSDYADELCNAVKDLILSCGVEGRIKGVGVGAPCVNHITGVIEGAADLPWPSPIPLAEELSKRMGLPVKTGNDANAAALGEQIYGAGKGLDDFIMITLGTGVGSGIVIDGRLIYGHKGLGGELGHVIVESEGRQCGCGRKGCLETYCSAGGIVTTAKKMLATSNKPSELRNLKEDEITSKTIAEAALKGDSLAKDVYDFTGKMLGEACADFAAFSSPQAFILFGGVAKAGKLITEPMEKAMKNKILHLYRDHIKILCSELPDADAAVLGASALAWE